MQDYKFNFEIDGKSYDLVISLNVLQEVQKKYGTVQKWGELTGGNETEVNIEALIFGYTAMLNEAIDIKNQDLSEEQRLPFYTEKQVGRIITSLGLRKATEVMNNAVVNGTKSDDSKNV